MALAMLLGVHDSRNRRVPVGFAGVKGTAFADKSVDMLKSDLFQRIKCELEGGLVEELLAAQENDEEENMVRDEAMMMGNVMVDVQRPLDQLLREFGW